MLVGVNDKVDDAEPVDVADGELDWVALSEKLVEELTVPLLEAESEDDADKVGGRVRDFEELLECDTLRLRLALGESDVDPDNDTDLLAELVMDPHSEHVVDMDMDAVKDTEVVGEAVVENAIVAEGDGVQL